MKTRMKNKKFSEETVLDVKLKDAQGNPIEAQDEKKLTQEQINFCAKVAAKMYKKFASSKLKKFDAEEESIEVTIPEDIENANVDQIVEDAAKAREDAVAEEQVVATVTEDPEKTEKEEFCDDVKEFAASLRKFAKGAKKFSEEEMAEIKEQLADLTEAVSEISEEQKQEATPIEEVKEFTAKLSAHRAGKKFSAEDLEEIEKLESEVKEVVEELQNPEPEDPNHQPANEGVTDLKKFAATCGKSMDAIIGEGSVAEAKAAFFAK